MDIKERRARVVDWEDDDKYISVWYTDKNGERVCAAFKRIGWNQAPSDVVARCIGVTMDRKRRRARIVSWGKDDKIISVWYTDKNGERVCAVFERVGWNKAPSDVVARVMKALSRGPRYVVGSRGRS
jgi:hypothetical protein